jgi:anaerobic ribonucleoside-triphosphate reductase
MKNMVRSSMKVTTIPFDEMFTIKCAYCQTEGYRRSFSLFTEGYVCEYCGKRNDLVKEEIESGGIIFTTRKEFE